MSEHSHDQHDHEDHEHSHNHKHGHGHTHGLVDESIVRSKAGVKAVSISFLVLLITSVLQLFVYLQTSSIALLTDVIHNAGDSLTAIPLGLAFFLKSKKGEHVAGYIIVGVIFISALFAMYHAIEKFIEPQAPTHLLALALAGIIGVIGNELAAIIRWRAGRKLNSPALIADGNHARSDGLVSVGVILSALIIALGFPIADPIIGIIISLLILRSSWDSLKTIRQA